MAKNFSETVNILDSTGRRNRIKLENNATVWIGGDGASGDLLIPCKDDAQSGDPDRASVRLTGGDDSAFLCLGAPGIPGWIGIFAGETKDNTDWKLHTIILDAEEASLRIGNLGKAGHIYLFPSSGKLSKDGTASIHLDGEAGDIILKKGDAAEDFDVDESSIVDPGTVVVIGGDTKLHECRQSYDKRVAGVIAGAGESNPGIILGRQESKQKRLPLALMGKVFCKADAKFSPIELGDLLTTSPTPGHAMKASDPVSAFGAVLGKALGPLQEGRDLIPVLVALQ